MVCMFLFKSKNESNASERLLATHHVTYDGESAIELPPSNTTLYAYIRRCYMDTNLTDGCAMAWSIFIPGLLLSFILLAREFCWFGLPCDSNPSVCMNVTNASLYQNNRSCVVPFSHLPCDQSCVISAGYLPPVPAFVIAFAVCWQLLGCCLLYGSASRSCSERLHLSTPINGIS
jgi:hypothetical protein